MRVSSDREGQQEILDFVRRTRAIAQYFQSDCFVFPRGSPPKKADGSWQDPKPYTLKAKSQALKVRRVKIRRVKIPQSLSGSFPK